MAGAPDAGSTRYGYRIADLEAEYLRLMERRRSFRAFVGDLILSKPGYVAGNHIDTLCEYAQKFFDGEYDRLIVTLPPRHSKSTIFSEALPAWILGNNPQAEIIIASYNDGQSAKMMTASRLLMEEPEYKRSFTGIEWVQDNIHDAMIKGKLNGRPNMISRGPGSGITGSGADYIIIDDIFKSSEDAYSSIRRDKVYDWYRSTALTRLSPGGKVLLVGTRWHYDDLIGRVLQEDGWKILHLPAISDDGKALWPERFSLAHLERTKAEIGSLMFSAIYQGRPTPMDGGMFTRSTIQYIDNDLGPDATRVRYYDMAATEGDGDYTVGCLMSTDGETYVIEDISRGQRSAGANEGFIRTAAREDGIGTYILMEEEGGSAGKTAINAYSRILAGYAFQGVRSTGPKEIRATALAAGLESGLVKIRRASWNRDLVDEMTEFPFGAHDDQVDACAGAYNFLTGNSDIIGSAGNFGAF